MCVFAIHINLVELWKVDVEVGCAELVYLLNRTRSLLSELVTRKVENFEALSLIFLVERLQFLVLRRESASSSSIHYQQYLPFVVGE